MKEIKIETENLFETQELGEMLALAAQANDVFILSGNLGAGKTQFAKGFARGLGVSDVVSSPTFNLLLVYDSGWLTLNHFDLYRLTDETELEGIDFFGVLESEGVSLIEWGERFEIVRELADVIVRIENEGEEGRSFSLSALDIRGEEILAAFAENRRNA